MCGIAGVFASDRQNAEKVVGTMNSVQLHRGPDDEGLNTISLKVGFLTLGHRRLSILDLSPAGHQPMINPATGDWIVFNGEIYNYPELRKEFESSGVGFHSHCDTEVILHAFARWGTECFKLLHGMFAIAIYQKAKQRLILARDSLGIKPLYYAATKNGFVFASELRAIDASGLVNDELDRRAVAGLLAYGSVPGPLTMRKEVRLLESGTYAVLDLADSSGWKNQLRLIRYWDFPPTQTLIHREEALEQVHTLLESAASSHLLSDVPVGLFLSGGLDSTVIAALCSKATLETLNTFTISLTDRPDMDEKSVAEYTAQQLGTKHHTLTLTETEVREQTQHWLNNLDQPSVDGLNTYIISGAVRKQGIKVALSGLGGDELFGGYSSFREVPRLASWLPWLRWIPHSLRSKAVGMLFANKSKSQRQKAQELINNTYPKLRNLYFRRRRLFSDLEMYALGFNPQDLDLNEDFWPPEVEPDRALSKDSRKAISILESRFYMGNMLLRDSDVFGMAHGLEIRVPLLDKNLIEYVMALPGKWRVGKKGYNKPLLADALSQQLPQDVHCLPKRGFSLSQSNWMAGPLRERFEQYIAVLSSSGLVEPDAVSCVWQDFLEDKQGPTWSRTWMLGVLGAWIESNKVSTLEYK